MNLLSELKRRNVFKVGATYLVLAWIVIQITDAAVPALRLPEWVNSLVFLLGILGFPFALFFAWAFELTPDGIKKEIEVDRSDSIANATGRKLDFTIITLLLLALVYFVWEARFSPSTAPANASTAEVEHNLADNILSNKKSPSEASIAALPFENRSPDKNDAFFAAGIHDDLLTHLANFNAFKVISRTSVMEYKNTTKNIKQIGEELGVNNILEGAVQRSGNRIRINVQLIDAKTDKHLWAKIYDRKLTTDNLFDIQSEISQAIAEALKITLAPEKLKTLSKPPTQNLTAYDLYLQARQFSIKNTANNYQTAINILQEVLTLDPKFKQAWTELANAQLGFYWFSQGSTSIRDEALRSLKMAEAIDPDFPELARIYGLYYYWGFLDYTKALTYLNQAINERPNDGDAYMIKGWVLRRSGLWQEAILAMRKSLELNPRAAGKWLTLAESQTYLYRYTNALSAIKKAQSINNIEPWLNYYYSKLVLIQHGDIKFAQRLAARNQFSSERINLYSILNVQILSGNYQKALNKVAEITDPEEIWRQSILLREDYLAQIYYFQGNSTKAKQAAQTTLKRLKQKSKTLGDDYRLYLPQAGMAAILGQTKKVNIFIEKSIQTSPRDALEELISHYQYARIFAMAGLLTETIKMLEPQLSPPSATSVNYVKIDPAFNKLRDQPEFKAMMARHPQVMGSTEKEANQ